VSEASNVGVGWGTFFFPGAPPPPLLYPIRVAQPSLKSWSLKSRASQDDLPPVWDLMSRDLGPRVAILSRWDFQAEGFEVEDTQLEASFY